jgi:hypothetical protein
MAGKVIRTSRTGQTTVGLLLSHHSNRSRPDKGHLLTSSVGRECLEVPSEATSDSSERSDQDESGQYIFLGLRDESAQCHVHPLIPVHIDCRHRRHLPDRSPLDVSRQLGPSVAPITRSLSSFVFHRRLPPLLNIVHTTSLLALSSRYLKVSLDHDLQIATRRRPAMPVLTCLCYTASLAYYCMLFPIMICLAIQKG